MAGEQGTGKHPHKSAAEPFEHHGASTTKGGESPKTENQNGGSHKAESHSTSSKEEHSSDQGTGKHPHKKASDPKEHHEGAKK